MAKKPVRYSRAKFDGILQRMKLGETLKSILSGDDMPSHAAFLDWTERDEEHSEAYESAWRRQTHVWIDDAVHLAKQPVDDVPLPPHLEDSADELAKIRYKKSVANSEMQRRRLEIDTMKWLATKALTRYGDRSKVEVGGQLVVEAITYSSEDQS